MFNLSSIANLRISVPSFSWSEILNPKNLWNQTGIQGNITFINDNVIFNTQVEIKLKGSSTRSTFVRGYALKLKKMLNVERIDLKSFEPSYLTNLLSTDVYRSMMIPSPRSR